MLDRIQATEHTNTSFISCTLNHIGDCLFSISIVHQYPNRLTRSGSKKHHSDGWEFRIGLPQFVGICLFQSCQSLMHSIQCSLLVGEVHVVCQVGAKTRRYVDARDGDYEFEQSACNIPIANIFAVITNISDIHMFDPAPPDGAITKEQEVWTETTNTRNRIRSVAFGLRDPATVAIIADRAQCSANTARTHLEEFVTLGIVRNMKRRLKHDTHGTKRIFAGGEQMNMPSHTVLRNLPMNSGVSKQYTINIKNNSMLGHLLTLICQPRRHTMR